MDNPTLPNYAPSAAGPRVRAASTMAPPRPRDRLGLALGRIWLVANFAAVAALGVALAERVAPGLFIAWSVFTLLNAMLLLVARSALAPGAVGAPGSLFVTALGAVLGLAWGGACALFIGAAESSGLAVMLGASYAIGLIAIPVFYEQRAAFIYFVATFSALSSAAMVVDERYASAAIWLALASATLLLLGSVYRRTHQLLQRALQTLLEASNAVTGDHRRQVLAGEDLIELAEQKGQALKRLRGANDRNRRVLRALGDAVIATDAAGRVEYLNPVAEVLLGWTQDELRGRPLEQGLYIVLPPGRRNHARDIFEQTRLTRRIQHGDEHCQLIRRDGVVYGIEYVITPIRSGAGEFLGAACIVRDVTEKRHRAKSVAWAATHDPLTGAINRSEFEARLKKLTARSSPDRAKVHALLTIDIDNFKFINDSYGHAAGDAALRALADVLRTRIRGADTLARVGGDEFSALLYSCSGEKARLIAEGLRVAVERHEFKWQSITLPISLSIGIVEINASCESITEILRAADAACYSAKKLGRNRVRVFEPGHQDDHEQSNTFDIVKYIQSAIQGDRLEMFYEPMLATGAGDDTRRCILSVAIRAVGGALIPRAKLDEITRRFQLAEDFDRWSAKAAIDALRLDHPALRGMGFVVVPLSGQSMRDERLLNNISAQLRDHEDLAERLCFSVDECELGGKLDDLRYFITALKQFGCRFMISEVGFGGRAVELVKAAPVDILSIDSALVRSMLQSSVDYELVLGLSRVARALGMQTLARGADTAALREAAGKMGLDFTCGGLDDQPRPVAQGVEA